MDFIEQRLIFRDPGKYADQEINVCGWVRTNRNSNRFGFIELNDGTFFKSVQIVYEAELIDNFEEVAKLPLSTALSVVGTLVLTPGAKQPFEIKAKTITVEAPSDADYPIQNKRHSLEYLRTQAHLRPRTNTFSAVFRVRSVAAFAIHKFFQERGFVYAHPPLITASDAEGAGEMFKVTTLDLDNVPRTPDGKVDYDKDFFGKPANLTVSGQLEAEIFALAFKNTYTFGPTFRAENSNTARHASEFWMIEPEMAFCDLQQNMDVIEAMVKYIITYVLENCPEEMNFFNSFIDKGLLARLDHVVNSEFIRLTYTRAIEILEKAQADGHKFEYKVTGWGMDLQSEHERYLTEEVFKAPVFLIDYPSAIKAFYMRENEDGKTVAACDLLVPGVGEIVGGSQREERYDVLLNKIRKLGMDEQTYWWYLELRKYGGVKHSGYGLGFERMIMYLTGMSNIRDVLPFPRTPRTADF
ncbi:MAG: asparagine--tRNA ligase [Firmicutes bacterium]|nr:asparagine--tRNA ligase [Bacillota bacterium]MBQ1888556.1 asparagine--tRNA ligase [Bacillota bacterium]MBQ3578816.1 asparagine--tRNA ligase [Bacillota bacterium]MBQ4181108.1 asparagine--tRNA ligase [Bacillota bacterium]MBQ4233423.1 asparagine--tRNA ligase [Bacillota bacterium]